MFLKFVDLADEVPHRSFMIECDSFHKDQIIVKKGETLEKYSPSIEQTSFPFEDDSRWEATEINELVLIVNVTGAKGYKYIAGRNMLLFVMNDQGSTIDKTRV